MFRVTQHGSTIAEVATYLEALHVIHKRQPQSADYAMAYDGYAIQEEDECPACTMSILDDEGVVVQFEGAPDEVWHRECFERERREAGYRP